MTDLQSALHTAAATAQNLRFCLNHAQPIAALVLLPLIEDAVKVQQRIEALIDATQDA